MLCNEGLFNVSVDEDMPLYDILNEFQKGHSHMAVVIRKNIPSYPTEQAANNNGGTFGELKHSSYSSQTCIWIALSSHVSNFLFAFLSLGVKQRGVHCY
jgi:hypothetical protein